MFKSVLNWTSEPINQAYLSLNGTNKKKGGSRQKAS